MLKNVIHMMALHPLNVCGVTCNCTCDDRDVWCRHRLVKSSRVRTMQAGELLLELMKNHVGETPAPPSSATISSEAAPHKRCEIINGFIHFLKWCIKVYEKGIHDDFSLVVMSFHETGLYDKS